MAGKNPESVPSRFQPGDKVRVKHGVRDPDFPDIPLGGWAGTVQEVHQVEGETRLLVAWDRAALEGMHPTYKKRCERDALELELMWLGEEDLEPKLFDANADSGCWSVIKHGMIDLPVANGLPGELILVDPVGPEDRADPTILNLDRA